VAVPKNHLTRLEQVLIAAKLKPISFSLAITALQPPGRNGASSVLALAVGENAVDLQLSADGGLVALRELPGVIAVDGARRRVDADLLRREIRLTRGQAPQEFSDSIKPIRVFGRAEWSQALADAIAPVAKRLGLSVEVKSGGKAGGQVPPASVLAAQQ